MSLFLCLFGISLGEFVEKILPKAGVWKKGKKEGLDIYGGIAYRTGIQTF